MKIFPLFQTFIQAHGDVVGITKVVLTGENDFLVLPPTEGVEILGENKPRLLFTEGAIQIQGGTKDQQLIFISRHITKEE